MNTKIDLNILEEFVCLEPKIGERLLLLYPDFLSAEEKTRVELHLKGCELCQERLKLWRVTGLKLRIPAFIKQARELLQERHYDEAIRLYNIALELDPKMMATSEGQAFFDSEAWFALTTARTEDQDLTPYVAPSYAPERYQMAAAKIPEPLPLAVEFADGKVKGEFSSAGQLVFFELLETWEEFEAGVMLVGHILQPVVMLRAWEIPRGQKQRLGTIEALFGAGESSDVLNAISMFKVFPA
jgi:tetratricopeptide (TPR) repeat protein